MTDDPGYQAQRAAEAHLAACNEAFWAAEEMAAGADWEDIESPASAPYDACDTCVVREVLYAAWPIIEAATREPDGAGHAPGPASRTR